MAKVSDIDPKASSVDVYTKSSIPLSESTMHLSSLSRFNLDGMTQNADGSYRIAGTTSITPPSTGDIEIAFQAVPSEENADKYIPSAKTVRTLKF